MGLRACMELKIYRINKEEHFSFTTRILQYKSFLQRFMPEIKL